LIEPDFFQDVLNSGEMVVENFARHIEKADEFKPFGQLSSAAFISA